MRRGVVCTASRNNQSSMMAEASFLSSQKARIDALQRHQKPSNITELTSVRSEIRTIQNRLHTETLDPHEIQSVRESLQILRRRCTDELHVSDVRWMHRELSLCHETLLELTKAHAPKFTFQRYRALLLKQQRQGNDPAALVIEEATKVIPTPETNETPDDRRLSGYDSATVRVAIDGALHINGVRQDRMLSSNALMLKDMSSCTIHLYVCDSLDMVYSLTESIFFQRGLLPKLASAVHQRVKDLL